MKVKDVMHRGVTWVEPATSIREIAQMMRDADIGSVPVGENDRLVGIVTDRDIICRGIADSADCNGLTARLLACRSANEIDSIQAASAGKRIESRYQIDEENLIV